MGTTSAKKPAVVRLTGDLDVFLKGKLRTELQAAPDGGVLVIDLSGVTFIDSAGLSVLVDVHKRMTRTGGDVRLVVLDEQPVYRILQITGLTRIFKIFTTEAAAIVD